MPHCDPGPDVTYRGKWCGNEWINDLRLASIVGIGHASNGQGSSPKQREDPQCVMGYDIENDMGGLDPGIYPLRSISGLVLGRRASSGGHISGCQLEVATASLHGELLRLVEYNSSTTYVHQD